MSGETGKDWKWQVVDALDDFVTKIDPSDGEAWDLLLEDEGQVNLTWDALAPYFPTFRFKSGDQLTAVDLGRLFGHWRSLWIALITSKALHERYQQSYQMAVEVRDKIDTIMLEHYEDAVDGVRTSVVHLLAVTNDPAFLESIRLSEQKFEALGRAIREFVCMQPDDERAAFMRGYSQALRAEAFDESGLPIMPDKLAALLAFCRPFAIRANLAASDFQEYIDKLAGANITGNPEAFAMRLRRRGASLRGKGRPPKKSDKVAKPKRGKSDKN